MPAFESRRVRTHPRTVTSLSTATRPWSTSATGTTLIIFSLLIVGKNKHLSTRKWGYLCYLASAIRQAEFANAAKDFGIKGKKGSRLAP